MAPAFVSFSRNSQIVVASATRSPSPRPRNRMKESRSLMELGALVGEGVLGLDHQDLEHQHRIVGWPAALCPVKVAEHCLQLRPEDLEVHCLPVSLKLIAQVAQPAQPLVNIEEAQLTPLPILLPFGRRSESRSPKIREVLQGVQLRLLQAACEAWDMCQAARAALALHGLTFLTAAGEPRARPEVAIERDSSLAFARL